MTERIRAALFALVWFSCSWFGSWEMNPNNAVRLFATIGLVEHGDPAIDPFAALTIDKAQFAGRFYSDKAPGMTIMAIPAVAIGDLVTGQTAAEAGWPGGYDFTRYLKLRQQIAVATGPALLTALAAVALFDLGLALTGSVGGALAGALGFALGTPVWGWSTTLLGHAPVAALFVIAIWAVWRERGWIVGAALGWAVVIEHQAVLGGGGIAVWAMLRWWRRPDRWRLLGTAAVAGIVALVPLVAYNLLAFGTVFRIGYSGVVGWEGMQQGVFGLGWPRPTVLGAITVGWQRGLVWVAPILVVAPVGLVLLGGHKATRGIAVTAGAVAVVALLINAAYVYWDGGNSTGPRIAVPAIAGLAIGIAPLWTSVRSAVARFAMGALLAGSIAIDAAIAAAEIFAPPGYPFPVWGAVIDGRFRAGDLRTVGSDWWGWTPWQGFGLWVAVAMPALAYLVWTARRAYPRPVRVTGA